jgi:gliding motility-associated-like protein
MKFFKLFFSLITLSLVQNSWSQTPSACNEYTTIGTSGSNYNAGSNAGCNSNVGGQVAGTAPWTGTGCAGTLVSTVVGPPVSCLTLAYTAVNTNDYGTISVDGGGTITITGVNCGVVGNVVGPFDCGGSYGDVAITICSTLPFTQVTLTNTGCTSGWVINCATQTGCGGGGGGNAGADDLTTLLCGGTVDLDGLVTGDAGGVWEETTIPASGSFNIGTAVFDADAAGAGIYTFEYILAGGCSGGDTAEFQVEVVPNADASWTVPAAPCANAADVDLSALVTGTAGGVWTGTGVTGNLFDPTSGSQNLTYTVGTAPCDDVITQMFNVTPSDDPNWITPGDVCEANGLINLSALLTGTAGGTWSGAGVTGTNFDPSGLNGPVSITYIVGIAPCTGTFTDDIIVNPDVDPTWLAPVNLCDSSPLVDLTATLSGTNGGIWSGVGVTGTDFDPAAGSQTITYTVGLGTCTENLALPITVGVTPDPSWTSLSLCASAAPYDLAAQITGTTGGTWSGIGLTGSVFDPAAGAQSITYTVSAGTCSDFSTQTIDVGEPDVTLAATNVTCFGEADGTATATVTGGSGNYTYSWAPGGQNTANVTGLLAGSYTITVTDLTYGCSNDVTVDIIEPAELTLTVTAVDACIGSGGGEATAGAFGGVGGFTYEWMPSGQLSQIASGLDSAMHIAIATDANGCTVQDSIAVNIWPLPSVNTFPAASIEWGDCVPLGAIGAATYSWEPNYEIDCENCQSPVACPEVTTTYCVTGINSYGCTDTACMLVNVEIVCGEVFVPSGFSPNGDNENDFLCVYSDCMDAFVFEIYNRWGEKVYETAEMSICWDGTWKGKELNSAVFVYTLEGYLINGDRVSQKGNISLVR